MVAEHSLNNTLQMRALSANESPVSLTKQMKVSQCERVRVELANRCLEHRGSWVVNQGRKDTAQASDVGSMLLSEPLQQLSEPTYCGFFAPIKSFWTVLDPIEVPIPK